MDNRVSQSSSSSVGGDLSSITTSNNNNNSNSRDDYLRHLNKLSHKISKPTSSSSSTPSPAILLKKPPPPPPPHFEAPNPNPAPPQHQPPVYNINKSDFRDVVQKLTGSPSHDNNRPSSAAGAPAPLRPAAATSRLHRIRPPPLSHFAARPQSQPLAFSRPSSSGAAPPLSPLPPLPAVHGAAESPVSAYMRYLHTSMASDAAQKNQASFPSSASGFSPRWSNLAPIPPMVAPGAQFQIPPPPSAPIPFGCLNSPRSPYPISLSSPSSSQLGFPQLPLSPTVPPMPSPRWRSF